MISLDPLFADRVAARVRGARLKSGMSLADVSRVSRLTTSELRKLEQGTHPISLERLHRLSVTYGVPAAKFLDERWDIEQVEPEPLAPPKPTDNPDYLFDTKEKRLINAFRKLRPMECSIALVVVESLPRARASAHEPANRKRSSPWKRDQHAHILGTADLGASTQPNMTANGHDLGPRNWRKDDHAHITGTAGIDPPEKP